MAQMNSTTKGKEYKHLDAHERGQIEYGLKNGDNMRKISILICRDVSTISREIKKGTVKQMTTELKFVSTYFADRGQYPSHQPYLSDLWRSCYTTSKQITRR